MSWKQRQKQIQFQLSLRQNAWLLSLIAIWMAFSGAVLVAQGHTPGQALQTLFFFRQDNSPFGFFYESMTDFVVFGLVVSVILVDMQRQVRPEASCRVMCGQLEGHAVIFHMSNLGKRVWQSLSEADVPVAVVDPEMSNLEPLIQGGYPCMASSGRTEGDMRALNVAQARFVLVASDDLESAAVICSLVRRFNSQCDLVVRCLDDDIGEVMARHYKATLVSTSRVATGFVQDYVNKHRIRKCIVVGSGPLAQRSLPVLQAAGVDWSLITHAPENFADLADDSRMLVWDHHDSTVFEQAGVIDTELVLLTEDDLNWTLAEVDRVRERNPRCHVVCRVFHDDAADVLRAEPFRCEIFSTSRYAVEHLRKLGAFKSLGLGGGGSAFSAPTATPPAASIKAAASKKKPTLKKPAGRSGGFARRPAR